MSAKHIAGLSLPLVTSEKPASIELTAYQGGPAVIRENRSAILPAGKCQLFLAGLPTQFVPGSLTLVSAGGEGRFKMISTSFRDANLSTAAILSRAVGSHIVLFEETPRGITRHTGTLLHIVDGRTAVIKENDENAAVKIVPIPAKFELVDGLPDGLSALSSLVMDVSVSAAGEYRVSNLYESEGINWRPWYEIFYDAKAGKLTRFAGYVELTNQSGTDFEEAGISLIAGQNISTAGQPPRRARGMQMRAMSAGLESAPMGGAADDFEMESADVENVGEQKMYSLAEPVTLENGETMNPALVFASDIPVEHEYHLTTGYYQSRRSVSDEDLPKLPIQVKLRVKNNKANNLGVALPPGIVRVLEPDSKGKLQKTDTSRVVGHISDGESFSLALVNPTRDIKATRELTFQKVDPEPQKVDETTPEGGMPPVKPMATAIVGVEGGPDVGTPAARSAVQKQVSKEKPKKTPRFQEEVREIRIFNYKDAAVTVIVAENIPANAQILENSQDFATFNGSTGAGFYEVDVAAGSKEKAASTLVRYRLKWQIN
ncbi:MAG: hypothetical protein K8F91_14255 [Candidatus Obscuribacterales bacterium]|nr:hypothetical protein [Candidatus Obscuribacterales bacterium]